MRNLKHILLAAAAAALAACSGGSDDTLSTPPGAGPNGTVQVSSLTLLTSSPQIASDGTEPATISALVRDSNNNVMPDVAVLFTASSGSLTPGTPAVTNASGVQTATLSPGFDPTNRAITVSALAGNAQAAVTVNVIGTTLLLNGPTSLAVGSTGPFNVVLTNAANAGIANIPVTVTSSRANGISQTPITTDTQGRASFTLAANNGGADTITVSALGIQATQTVTVSSDSFTFTAPDPNANASQREFVLGAVTTITTRWTQAGAAVANQSVQFSTTRGTLSTGSVLTNGAGDASVTVTATNAGPAVITATNASGTSIQLPIEFVATVPATLDLQASPFTVPTSDQSAITAIVRDANGNFVKNQLVNFVLQDVSGGSLSVAQARTNSQGRAQTFYNSGNTTSAVDAVRIDATVQGTAVTDFVRLTVARREVFISIGTGNEIEQVNNDTQYRKQWVVQVTDSQGNGVGNVPLTVSILSERYWEGERAVCGQVWCTRIGVEAFPIAGCQDEDKPGRNGVLDNGEDFNNNGRIEAGNIAAVAPHGGTGNAVKTDGNGFAILDVSYPQEFALWLEVTLEARTSVQGTEFAESTKFLLPIAADDNNDVQKTPPGVVSPFGPSDNNCATIQ